MGLSNSKNKKAKSIFPKKFMTLGYSGSGKSSFLYRLKYGWPKQENEFMDPEYQQFDYGGLQLEAWNQPGRVHYRFITRFYLKGFDMDGVVFMIDSTDMSNINGVLEYLQKVLEVEDLTKMTVMVVANKQDLDGAVGPEVIEEEIKKKLWIAPGITVFVMPMSVTSDDDRSLQLAYRFFVKTMIKKDRGKAKTGLIPHAWETAEKEAVDSDVEVEKEDGVGDRKPQPTKNDDVKMAKDKDILEDKKKSLLFRDPIHIFKSILCH